MAHKTLRDTAASVNTPGHLRLAALSGQPHWTREAIEPCREIPSQLLYVPRSWGDDGICPPEAARDIGESSSSDTTSLERSAAADPIVSLLSPPAKRRKTALGQGRTPRAVCGNEDAHPSTRQTQRSTASERHAIFPHRACTTGKTAPNPRKRLHSEVPLSAPRAKTSQTLVNDSDSQAVPEIVAAALADIVLPALVGELERTYKRPGILRPTIKSFVLGCFRHLNETSDEWRPRPEEPWSAGKYRASTQAAAGTDSPTPGDGGQRPEYCSMVGAAEPCGIVRQPMSNPSEGLYLPPREGNAVPRGDAAIAPKKPSESAAQMSSSVPATALCDETLPPVRGSARDDETTLTPQPAHQVKTHVVEALPTKAILTRESVNEPKPHVRVENYGEVLSYTPNSATMTTSEGQFASAATHPKPMLPPSDTARVSDRNESATPVANDGRPAPVSVRREVQRAIQSDHGSADGDLSETARLPTTFARTIAVKREKTTQGEHRRETIEQPSTRTSGSLRKHDHAQRADAHPSVALSKTNTTSPPSRTLENEGLSQGDILAKKLLQGREATKKRSWQGSGRITNELTFSNEGAVETTPDARRPPHAGVSGITQNRRLEQKERRQTRREMEKRLTDPENLSADLQFLQNVAPDSRKELLNSMVSKSQKKVLADLVDCEQLFCTFGPWLANFFDDKEWLPLSRLIDFVAHLPWPESPVSGSNAEMFALIAKRISEVEDASTDRNIRNLLDRVGIPIACPTTTPPRKERSGIAGRIDSQLQSILKRRKPAGGDENTVPAERGRDESRTPGRQKLFSSADVDIWSAYAVLPKPLLGPKKATGGQTRRVVFSENLDTLWEFEGQKSSETSDQHGLKHSAKEDVEYEKETMREIKAERRESLRCRLLAMSADPTSWYINGLNFSTQPVANKLPLPVPACFTAMSGYTGCHIVPFERQSTKVEPYLGLEEVGGDCRNDILSFLGLPAPEKSISSVAHYAANIRDAP